MQLSNIQYLKEFLKKMSRSDSLIGSESFSISSINQQMNKDQVFNAVVFDGRAKFTGKIELVASMEPKLLNRLAPPKHITEVTSV